MRQVTGSNQPRTVKYISVRLLSGGDTFLIDEHLSKFDLPEDHYLKVELLSHRVLLTTKSILGRSTPLKELESAGIFLGDEEQIVTIEDRDFVALIVAPKILVETLNDKCDGRYEFISPILHRPVISESHVLLDVCEGLAMVKVYNKGWQLFFVDVYDVPSTASLVYWVQRLSVELKLKSYPLYIYRYSNDISRLINKNFKKILYANSMWSI